GGAVGVQPPRFIPDTAEQRRLDGALESGDRAATAAGYVAGYDLPWNRVFPPGSWVSPSLPAYPFERESYWPEAAAPLRSTVAEPAIAIPTIVPALAAHRVTWVPVDASARRPLGGPVAVVAAANSFGLADAFRSAGAIVFPFEPDGPVAMPTELARFTGLISSGTHVVFLAFRSVAVRTDFTPPGRGDVVALFRLVKALAAQGTPVRLTVVTNDTYAVGPEPGPVQPWAGAVVGLAKAAGREFPAWSVRVIDVASGELPGTAAEWVRRLTTDPGSPSGEPVAYRAGRRWERRLEPIRPVADARNAFRVGGTFLIAGGLGRVGREIARFLADRFQARLALVGRRPLDADAERFLAELRHLGGDARYYPADVADAAKLASVVADVRAAWGPLHGVVQAAVAPYFAPLAQADEAEWLTALRAKLDGGAALYAATASEPLDVHLIVSSVGAFAAFPGNLGQSAYCAGCTAEEALAGYATAAGQPARWTAWGVWDHPSLSPSAVERMRAVDVHPHAPADGLRAMAELVAGNEPFAAVGRLTPEVWEAMGAAPTDPAAAARAVLIASASVDANGADLHAGIDRLARRLVADALAAAEMTVPASWKVGPGQSRLAAALAEMLVRGQSDPAALEPLPDVSELRPALELLRRCTAAVPAVLRGDRPATDVLFPGGSADLVERVYKEHPVLDRFHRAAAAAVASARPAVVLEIGAGTGATTGPVLAALAASGVAVEYVYTDVSPAFLARGRAAFAGPGRRFELLYIERDPAAQDAPIGSGDVVRAANVMHATRSVSEALTNARKLLRPGGRLVLSELTRRDDYATLTFGLLDGWWKFADPESRLPHSPLLSPAGWAAALTAAGFERVEVVSAADAPSHSLILAVAPAAIALPIHTRPEPRVVVALPAGDPLKDTVRRVMAAGLGVPIERIDPARPYADLGVDSIIAPQLIEQLNAKLGIRLRSTDLYNYATLDALTAHIRERFGTPAGLESQPEPSEPVPVLANTDRADLSNSVAIIGYAGRFPGAADVDAFWADLAAGRSAVREVPRERWDAEAVFDPTPGTPGKTYAIWGGFLEDFDRFDPLFFNIAPVEAEAMDPQQRIFLEEAWKALEDAGCPPARLAGSRCGVFVGASANEYRPAGPPGLRTLGGSVAILAARIAYILDLRGPALPVDTGCSSSLVAVHLACRSLIAGETDLAVAGGVSCSLFTPSVHLYLADARMAAADGKSKTFADGADGFVPAEAAGVLVLKRLDKALADGDRIHAVVRASGINQDGKTSGITAPSAVSQAALEAEVWRRAGIDPSTISYVEAHGTGTKLGDPIEIQALVDAFARLAPGRGPCRIGSAKTNVGHAMAAAGVVGLIKVLLSVRHRQLPPHLHFDRPNRHIDFENSSFVVNTELRPWVSPDGGPLRAAVSSFGFSGTNAHFVLEDAPLAVPVPARVGPWVFPLSGQTPNALAVRCRDLAAWLETNSV
ncbi:MAG: SDR family NAD(P)-dependent oxidoreductase, partial [Fimbriiglobus sp.]